MNVTFTPQQREEIIQTCAEIVATLKSVPLCEWYLYWHTVLLESLDDPEANPAELVLWALDGLRRLSYNTQVLNAQAARLQATHDEAQAAVRIASTVPVTIPARKIQVTNRTHKTILFVMGSSGLARQWQLTRRVAELAQVAHGTVRNALTSLTRDGLIEFYQHQGKPAGYRYGQGRPRALYALTQDGLAWYQLNYGDPVPSELDQAISRHKGVQHAVDILETRDLLRGLGLQVDDDPQPMLASADVWGNRSQPDLSLYFDGTRWPVEVQREVRTRNVDKWEKVLNLSKGYLVLILETAAHRCQQAKILRGDARNLPPGKILLSSLEELRESGTSLEWEEVITGTSG